MKVVLDIETVQAPREEWARLAGFDSTISEISVEEGFTDLFTHAQIKDRQKKEDELYDRSSFDGTFSRIICIGLLIFSDSMGPQGNVAWYGTNEKELLRRFWARIGDLRPTLFITHNGLGFDIPFIKKRSIIHQVKPSMEVSLARFRTEPVYDTMAIWSNWDTRWWVKLDVLARALGVETKTGSGDQVAEMWATGQGEAIAEYCLHDTYVTYACYQRMNFHYPQPRQEILKHMNLLHVE